MPAIDASSPSKVIEAFQTETRRIENLYNLYMLDPSPHLVVEIAEGTRRIGEGLFDLTEVPPALVTKAATASVGFLADVLSRLPELNPDVIPGGARAQGVDLPLRWIIPGTEIQLNRVTEGPRTGDYVFSAQTVARLPYFWERIRSAPPLRPMQLIEWVPAQQRFVGPALARLPLQQLPWGLQQAVLGTPLWKVLLILSIGLAVSVCVILWQSLARRAARSASLWERQALLCTTPLVLIGLIYWANDFIALQIFPTIRVANATTAIAVAALYSAAAWAAIRLAWLVAEIAIAHNSTRSGQYDAHLFRTIARVCGPIAAACVLVYGANTIGIPALGLLAGVSVGGVALALATQYTLENLVGGFVIMADHPFKTGDEILFDGIAGTVVAIGPRSTRIRRKDGSITAVPNASISKANVTNLSSRPGHYISLSIRAPLHINTESIVKSIKKIQAIIENDPELVQDPCPPKIYLKGFGSDHDCIDIEIDAFIRNNKAIDLREKKQEILLAALKIIYEVDTRAADNLDPRIPTQPEPAAAAR